MRARLPLLFAAGRARRTGVAAVLLALAVAPGCRSEPQGAARQQTAALEQTALGESATLELRPRQSAFRDIGKRADSDFGGGG